MISTLTRSYPPDETATFDTLHQSVELEFEQPRKKSHPARPGGRGERIQIIGLPFLHDEQQGIL